MMSPSSPRSWDASTTLGRGVNTTLAASLGRSPSRVMAVSGELTRICAPSSYASVAQCFLFLCDLFGRRRSSSDVLQSARNRATLRFDDDSLGLTAAERITTGEGERITPHRARSLGCRKGCNIIPSPFGTTSTRTSGNCAHSCEPLERRALLAAVAWTGGGDGMNWTDPNNWSSHAVPTSTDDVAVDVPSADPEIRIVSPGPLAVKSLMTSERLLITCQLTAFGDVTLQNGSIATDRAIPTGPSGTSGPWRCAAARRWCAGW